ncbi:small ribosomal subunit Rsm22 family protein [Spirobacillus cienkowskii]|uniref:small ribosomal subunit Rsm22 family protein n=1 Tax=Spirobacillus cienkowskii TaxID=495820 RepID=UPI0030CEFFD1
MSFYTYLQKFLEKELEFYSTKNIQFGYSNLSYKYRENRKEITESLSNAEERLSYLAARMPATFSAVSKVLQEIKGDFSPSITSVLDIGAGPGTAAWACYESINTIQKVSLIEKNKEMIELGKKLASEHEILQNATWIHKDLLNINSEIETADIVIASYSLNEIPENNYLSLLDFLWKKTNYYLIIIEPGTPLAFKKIHSARQWLIQQNAFLAAPCSHSTTCPAFINRDWCHFSARLQRSNLHKNLKKGEKGYEDEKFSYLIASKHPKPNYESRVIRHPSKHSGHLKLQLCTHNGIENVICSKKQGEIYKKTKKLEWGDRCQISELRNS